MTTNNPMLGRRRKALPRASWLLGAALTLPLAACDVDELLEVNDPIIITPEQLTDPALIPTVYNGAIRDFAFAWSGGGLQDAFVPATALFSDEMRSSDTFITRNATDRREQQSPAQGNTTDANFLQLQRARRAAEDVVAFIKRADPTNARLSHSLSISGYTYLAFGEAWCGAVPVSTVDESGQYAYGSPLSTMQLFDEAEARFTEAVGAGGSAAHTSLARIGLGRALLNQGQFAQAAAAVASVPTTFFFKVEHSTNTGAQGNAFWNLNRSNRRLTVSDVEGGNGLPYRSAMDPRVPYRNTGATGFDNTTPLYWNLRHPTQDADVPLADGVEARLIEAEAALRAGDVEEFVDIHNALRANVQTLMARYDEYTALKERHGLAADFPTTLDPLVLADVQAMTMMERTELHFRERAFWLYTTGHRIGDMRRLLRAPYNFTPAEAGYPQGPHHRGGAYSNDVAFPVPFDEVQNPNFDHDMCNVDQA